MSNYYNPTTVIFEDGSLEELANLNLTGNGRLFVGSHSLRNGDVDRVKALLDADLDVVVVEPTPDLTVFNECIQTTRQRAYRFIIGMGGGSVMDVGKVAAYAANKEGNVSELIAAEDGGRGVPYTAIPTTAGTGSEVTMWATVWDKTGRKKYSLAKQSMYPTHAVVDPELTADLPSALIAETGMDALSQAVEAFWARASNPTSDAYARQAIQLIRDNLTERTLGLFEGEEEIEARRALSLGSLNAGRAFSNTRTTGVHSVSYPLTLRFGVSHGRAVGMLLPLFMKYNLPFIGDKAGELDGLGMTPEAITTMLTDLNMPTRLSQIGVTEEDIPLIAGEGYTPGRADNNPGALNQEILEALLRSIL